MRYVRSERHTTAAAINLPGVFVTRGCEPEQMEDAFHSHPSQAIRTDCVRIRIQRGLLANPVRR